MLAVWAILTGCTTPTPALRVGLPLWTGYSPLYVAEARGMLDASRVQIIDYNSPAKMIRAYQLGNLDAVAVTTQYAVELFDIDSDHRAVMVLDQSSGGDALLARADITALSELSGRRLGVEASSLGVYMMHQALSRGGLVVNDVALHSFDIDAQLQAWQTGEVDAMITYEPIRTALLAEGGHVLFDSGDIPGEIMDFLIMRQPVVEARLDEVRALQEVWYTHRQLILDEPEQTHPLIADRLKTPASEIPEQLTQLSWPDRAQGRVALQGLDEGVNRGLQLSAEQQNRAVADPALVLSDALFP